MMDPLAHLQMLKDRAAGVGPGKTDIARVRALRLTTGAIDRNAWQAVCAKGWLEYGGQPLRLLPIAEDLGAELAPEPVAMAALAVPFLSGGWRDRVLAGECVVLPAWQESPQSLDVAGETVLRDGLLFGRKQLVPAADSADAFLVTTTDGLAIVERGAPGLSVKGQQGADGVALGTLLFDGTPAEALPGDFAAALEYAVAAAACYLFGVAAQAFTITGEVVAAREAFARTTGMYDAMQPRFGDMETQLALTRAAIDAVEKAIDTGQPLDQLRAVVSRAKLRATDAALVITRGCVQMHGAVHAPTSDIDLYAQKAAALASQFGSAAPHRVRIRQRAQATEA